MDYASIHGQDESNFTFRSQHRLPTQSAAAALNSLKEGNGKGGGISVGKDMKGADGLLSDVGGFRRGVVTEIWGPSGVGKTAFGMELAATALKEGGKVLWLSCQDPMPGPRFVRILSKALPSANPLSPHSRYISTPEEKQMLRNFKHLPYPTIVYLSWKLLMSDDPTSGFPQPGTSLFVIDKLDELLDKQSSRDLPEDPEERQKRGSKPPESLLNYWKTVHHAIRMLNKFAAKHNVAVVVLTPIDAKQERMCPAIDTQAWEMGVATRIMLWRQDMGERNHDVRLGRTVKKDGVVEKGEVFGFNVTEVGLKEVPVFLQDKHSHDFYCADHDRASSHAIQKEVSAEEGWDNPEPEEGYLDHEGGPDLDDLIIGGSPPPPSSPPVNTSQVALHNRPIHPTLSARTPSPTDEPQQTQNGTPVKSVAAKNLFAEDPQPLWEDEAPQVSYLSHGIMGEQAIHRYYSPGMPSPPPQQYTGPATLPRTAYTNTNAGYAPRPGRRNGRSVSGGSAGHQPSQ